MANANQLKVCPRCEVETAPAEKICNYCGFRLIIPDNPTFEVPAYVHFQKKEEEKKMELDTKSTESSTMLPKIAKMAHDHRLFWEECDDMTRVAAMEDAISCIRNLLNSRASIECLKQVNGIGKQIGKLSESIEEYFKNGGSYNGVRLPEAATSSSDPEDQEYFG